MENAQKEPTREWDVEELLRGRLMEDMTVITMLNNGGILTRERYLSANYGLDPEKDEIPLEVEAELPWDFQEKEFRIPWEETDEPTLRDLVEHGMIYEESFPKTEY